MAFNLDKNEGAKSSKKFDLTKSDIPASSATDEHKRKSRTWFFLIPALLLAGLAAWYLSSNRNAANENGTAATTPTDSAAADNVPASQAERPTLPADTLTALQKEGAVTSPTASAGNDSYVTNPENNAGNNSAVVKTSFNNKALATFPKGSNTMRNMDQSLVKDMIDYLRKTPDAVIIVNGYASSEGEPAFNQQISQSRANILKSYLVSKGIAARRINATGKGIDNPVESNDTEKGRIRNRRVEIVFQ